MASMSFDIFARDHASRTFDDVGDSAERLGRRLDGVGKSSRSVGGDFDGAGSSGSSLRGKFDGLGGSVSGLGGHLSTLGSRVSGMASSLLSAGASMVGSVVQLGAMAGAAASAASSVGGLVVALAPAAGALAAIPGAIALGVAAMSTLKVALSGVGEGFKAALSGDMDKFIAGTKDLSQAASDVAYELFQMAPAFKGLKDHVQDALFAPLVGQMWSLLPAINAVDGGMTSVAKQFGLGAQELVKFARSGETVWAIQSVFMSLRDSVSAFMPALSPLLTGFRDLGVVSAGWLADLAPGIAAVAQQFGWFMFNAAASGKALEWLDGALAVFKQLGAILGDVGGILKSVFTAMQTAGGGALGIVGQLLDKVNAFLKSADGQDALVTIFRTLNEIGSAFAPVIGALVRGLAGVAPIIGEIAKLVGPILTTAINALAPALQALGPGVISIFTNLGTAVQTLADSGALTDLATALAAIAIAVTPLLPALADILVPILQGLAVVVTGVLAPALTALVGWIGNVITAIKNGEGLDQDNPLGRFAAFVTGTVVPAVQAAAAWIGQAFTDIGTWVGENQATFDAWGAKIQEISVVVAGVWKQIWDLLVAVFTDVKTWIVENQDTWLGWGDKIGSIVQTLAEIVSGAWEFIKFAWDTFGGPLLDLIGGVFTAILDVIDGVMTAIKGVIDVIMGVITGDWERAWTGVKEIFSGLWDAIVGVLEAAWAIIRFQISNGLAVVGETWDGAWAKVKAVAETIWAAIANYVSGKIDELKNFVGRLAEIPGQVSDWFGRVKDGIVGKFNEAVTFVQSIPQRMKDALSNLGNLLWDSGRSMVQGLINGISSMIGNAVNTVTDLLNQIRARLPFSPAKVGPFSGRGWTLYSGMSMASGLADGLAKGEGMVAKAAAGVMGAASMSLSPSFSGGGAGMVPLTPQGGTTINLHFAGQPLIGRDEIYRLLISALNEAKGRGFNLGAVGGTV